MMSMAKGIVLKHNVRLEAREGAPYQVRDISDEAFQRFLNQVAEKRWRFILSGFWPCLLATIRAEDPASPIAVQVLVPSSTQDDNPIGFCVSGDVREVNGSPENGTISFSISDEAELAFGAEGREGLALRVSRRNGQVQASLVWQEPDGRGTKIVDVVADKSDAHAQVIKLPEGIGPRDGVAGFGMLLGRRLPQTWEQEAQSIFLVLYFAAQELWLSEILANKDNDGEEE